MFEVKNNIFEMEIILLTKLKRISPIVIECMSKTFPNTIWDILLYCCNGCGSYTVRRAFRFGDNSPFAEHLTHKILLRYYLFIEIITQSIEIAIYFPLLFSQIWMLFFVHSIRMVCFFYLRILLQTLVSLWIKQPHILIL